MSRVAWVLKDTQDILSRDLSFVTVGIFPDFKG
jgi:hypothetical protein